ncbi:helix-turn-helix domain-containing protein [Paraconexibacter antarcticus]|uniref:Helix-turn-helix domain-containing protein n=1 Tax=Paraconexibacter antarcticus TaxID=2949664 RepID=A0ABY5DS00_9ACTN|nr:helix-turn-helix domain-containing protein [Paraconexibacter antarcticus]UTI64803.1 helix-turn-helix domain-containing protein [Paraconexibacter antarcticus]
MAHQVVISEPSEACREVIVQLAGAMLGSGELDAITADMAAQIHDEIDGIPEELRPQTLASCRANVVLIIQMIYDGLEASGAVAPVEATHYAREYARAGMPVEALMRTYRIGHAVLSQEWLERLQHAKARREVLAEAVTVSSAWMFAYVDAVSAGIAESYMHERERWVRSAAALRADEVRAILDGRQIDEARASQRLRYALNRTHVGLVVTGEEAEDADATIGLYERVAHDVERAIGGVDALCIPLGLRTLVAWVSFGDERAPDLSAVGPIRGQDAVAAGVRLAVGEPARGIEGFRRTYEDALLAQRVSRMRGRRPGCVTRYQDAVLLGLLAQDEAAAARFVSAELGALVEDSDSARRVASTLKVFLEEGSSNVRAARRLGVHENTVAYRVKRAEALLGRPVDDRRLELRAALLLVDVVGRPADA